jgi:hypothetical protein
MTYFLGHYGKVKLQRKSAEAFSSKISPADINVTLNRFSFDESLENIVTGDQITITTTDSRGLDFLPAATWIDGTTQNNIRAYVSINALGGIRLFETFNAAINNTRADEYELEAFTGDPLNIRVRISGSIERVLGDVAGFTFNTDRETIETTTMSDKFKRMYSAGLISGGGTIDCFFNTENSGQTENSLLMLQLINRTDIGSEFKCFLQLTEDDIYSETQDIYYEFDAAIVKAGIEVRADQIISCVFDFVTTGEIRLLIGEPPGYLLKEDTDRIEIEESLDFLLTELTD